MGKKKGKGKGSGGGGGNTHEPSPGPSEGPNPNLPSPQQGQGDNQQQRQSGSQQAPQQGQGPPGLQQGQGPRQGPPGLQQGQGPRQGPPGLQQGQGPRQGPPGLQQGQGPRQGTPPGLQQGQGPRQGTPLGFQQGQGPRQGTPPGFQQGQGPRQGTPPGFQQGQGPHQAHPPGFHQGQGPRQGPPSGFQQGPQPQQRQAPHQGPQQGQGQGVQQGRGRGRGGVPGGAPGHPGPQRPEGTTWGPGPQGSQGAAKVPGPQGNQGTAWGPGPQGPQGAAKVPGPQGTQGAAWGPGPQGPQGASKGPGPQGSQGAAKGPGPQGSQGASKGPGPQGSQGAAKGPGPQGSQGAAKGPGPQGPQGPKQSQGAPEGPSKSVTERPLPQRANCPPAPKLGRPIKLEVNHLLLQIKDPNVTIYHYDVTIDPDKPKRFMRPVMMETQRKFYPRNHPGFDGRKNLYSRGPLPFNDLTIEVNVVDEERQDRAPKTFKVTIKLARDNISLKELFAYQARGKSTNPPQDVIQAVDVVLRSASAQNFVQVGRSFFCPPRDPFDLGSGMELWLGFFQSFIMGHRPYLNIDVAHKGFPKQQTLLNLLQAMAPRARDPVDAIRERGNEFEKFIKGLKVEYKIPHIESSKRTYRVNGLKNTALNERFQVADGRTMTIGEYFAREKNYNVRFPNLPCVHIGPREKSIIVPLELLLLLGGQATMKKLDEVQTANMIKKAATNVTDRKNKIWDAMKRANLNASKEVQEFGISVANQFTQVDGRILPPPKLAYHQQIVEPQKGVWRGGRFLSSRHLQKWIAIVTCRVERQLVNDFTDALTNEARRSNFNVEKCAPPLIMDCPPHRLKKDLIHALEQKHKEGFELVLVVISGYNKQVYGQVKQIAELQVGILTQCVKDVTVTRRNNQATIHNILLKINAKFNGTNQVLHERLPCFKNNILMIGADVTHPSPDSKDIPSVAAVTASHDLTAFKYNMKIRLQPPRTEIILDLKNIVCEQLETYRHATNGLPKHIIFYRDGVSEGQFQQVLDHELRAIQQACASFNHKPLITFLVVQKRHHTRFFPMDPRVSNDRNGNVPAGTIVDTEITHPTEIDFYLVSHASIQGVARPTKYHVLYDDARMSENEIHQLTYNLCHLFTRCDRAVSYPAPTYYAHLAASRGRVYLEGRQIQLENLGAEGRRIETAQNFTVSSPMYFV